VDGASRFRTGAVFATTFGLKGKEDSFMTSRLTDVGVHQIRNAAKGRSQRTAAFLIALSSITALGFSTEASALADSIEPSLFPFSAEVPLDGATIPEGGMLTASSGLSLSEPLPGAEITSGWGWRIHPILKRRRFHKGVDFGAPRGTPILAAADGVVEEIERSGHYGLYLRIRHNDRVETAYAHMGSFAPGLQKGDRVERGQFIATVGTSGWATGPHLYYEVIVDGSRVNPTGTLVQTGLHLRGGQSLEDEASADDLVDRDADRVIDRRSQAHSKHSSSHKVHKTAHTKRTRS